VAEELPYWREPKLSVLFRRALSLPGLMLITVLYLAVLPAVLVVALPYDLATLRDLVTCRCLITFAGNLLMHLVGIAGLFGVWFFSGRFIGLNQKRFERWSLAFETWWATTAFRMVQRIFRMKTIVENREVVAGGPLIVFPRHASIVDVLLPIIFVAGPEKMHLRFAMKRELLWDPIIDVFGHREPTAFVRRGTRDHAPQIAAVRHLMDGLRPQDGVVVFPEGTRFTQEKRARFLTRLKERDPESWERAKKLRHVLPPHRGGPFAVIDHDEVGADILFIAHTGLEGANHLRDFLGGSLLDTTLRVRFFRVPVSEVPTDERARLSWLYDQWERIDAFIEAHRPRV
jgi:1-acyl-sn-glycerol-3-phosphate acyltransferase